MYSIISQPELSILSQLSKSQILVYLVLSQHTREADSACFPSISRIMKLIGGAHHERTIYRALEALEKAGLIIRKHRKSLERFTLIVRKRWMLFRATAIKNKEHGAHAKSSWRQRQRKKRTKNNLYNDIKNKGSSIPIEEQPEETPSPYILELIQKSKDEQRVYYRKVCRSARNITELSDYKNISFIINGCFAPEDWAWLKQDNKILFDQLFMKTI